MSKYFLIDPSIKNVSRTDILSIEKERVTGIDERALSLEEKAAIVLLEDDTLKRVSGRVVVKLNNQNKNYYTFEGGEKIRLERQFNNLNRRETEPVNVIVIDADNISAGTEMLVYYNAIHDSNRVFNYKDKSPNVCYYSIKEEDCYLYLEDGGWKSIPPYETALRVFEPYTGVLENVDHKVLKDTLYVTSGAYKGKVVKTLRGCDFTVVFQNTDGREGNIVIFRPFGIPKNNLEEEAIAVLDELTKKVKSGTLYVGLNTKDCKPLKEYHGNQNSSKKES